MRPDMIENKNIYLDPNSPVTSSIVSVVKGVESALKIRIYSHKYYIVSYIYDNPYCNSLDIQNKCPSSNSTFYKCLGELRDSNIIRPLRSTADMRTRQYYLAPNVKLLLENRHKAIGEFFNKKLTFEPMDRPSIVKLVKSIESDIGFSYYSPEFEIIIFLYENEEAPPSRILSSINISDASFYIILKRLLDKKFINYDVSKISNKQKIYHLSDNVIEILDNAHRILVKSNLL